MKKPGEIANRVGRMSRTGGEEEEKRRRLRGTRRQEKPKTEPRHRLKKKKKSQRPKGSVIRLQLNTTSQDQPGKLPP